VLAVAKDLRLSSSEYILYGVSYGTMVATVAAALAEKGYGPVPAFLVLDGIVGKSDTLPEENFFEWIRQWEMVKNKLPSPIRDALEAKDPPLGLSDLAWGSWIVGQLSFRDSISNPNSQIADSNFSRLLLLKKDAASDAKKRFAHEINEAFRSSHTYEKSIGRQYKEIGCREISPSLYYPNQDAGFRLEKGKLVPVYSKFCEGIPFEGKYDSAEWQTSTPIYYFAGVKDPSTTIKQAYHHLNSQSKALRIFVEVLEGAHCPLSSALTDCSQQVWRSMGAGEKEFKTAVEDCDFESRVRIIKPNAP